MEWALCILHLHLIGFHLHSISAHGNFRYHLLTTSQLLVEKVGIIGFQCGNPSSDCMLLLRFERSKVQQVDKQSWSSSFFKI